MPTIGRTPASAGRGRATVLTPRLDAAAALIAEAR